MINLHITHCLVSEKTERDKNVIVLYSERVHFDQN